MANVLLALPRYGPVESESRIFSRFTTNRHQLGIVDKPTSALTMGFNGAWAVFLDNDWDYFAMQHADIGVDMGWIDVLEDALAAKDAGIAHMVTAIKDNHGLTSTALGDPFDRWRGVRRITVRELQGLPKVFGLEDLNHLAYRGPRCLLPNTGVMLIKKAPWCFKFPGFDVHNKIEIENGRRKVFFEPEDWNLGRWAGMNGVKVVGCWQCRTEHYGRMSFRNDSAWGEWAEDEEGRGEFGDTIKTEPLELVT